MEYKYGSFSEEQMVDSKKKLQGKIYFLLLLVEHENDDYKNMDIDVAINSTLMQIGGMNSLLNEPTEFVEIMSLLEAARLEYESESHTFKAYRKLILDAISKVNKIKEV